MYFSHLFLLRSYSIFDSNVFTGSRKDYRYQENACNANDRDEKEYFSTDRSHTDNEHVGYDWGRNSIGMYAGHVIDPDKVPVFSALVTLLILFFGEIAPKTLGAYHWRKAWVFVVRPLTVMNYALYPLVLLTKKFSDLLVRSKQAPSVTEDEILAFVLLGSGKGK